MTVNAEGQGWRMKVARLNPNSGWAHLGDPSGRWHEMREEYVNLILAALNAQADAERYKQALENIIEWAKGEDSYMIVAEWAQAALDGTKAGRRQTT